MVFISSEENIMIYVEGGTKKTREIVEKAAVFAFQNLIPKNANPFYVNISITKTEGAEGYCWEEDDDEYAIELNTTLSGDDLLTAVFHEMTHVKQYVVGEFEGVDINYKTQDEYLNQPHEIEAYRVQEELLVEWNKTIH